MEIKQSLESIAEPLRQSASVRNVYGEPIAAEGKTIIPVARIAYGFGGGVGKSEPGTNGDRHVQEGGGGGGGVCATPVGVVEVTAAGTRFIRFHDRRRMAAALGLGVAIGLLVARWLDKWRRQPSLPA